MDIVLDETEHGKMTAVGFEMAVLEELGGLEVTHTFLFPLVVGPDEEDRRSTVARGHIGGEDMHGTEFVVGLAYLTAEDVGETGDDIRGEGLGEGIVVLGGELHLVEELGNIGGLLVMADETGTVVRAVVFVVDDGGGGGAVEPGGLSGCQGGVRYMYWGGGLGGRVSRGLGGLATFFKVFDESRPGSIGEGTMGTGECVLGDI